jgi:hypothetical protein
MKLPECAYCGRARTMLAVMCELCLLSFPSELCRYVRLPPPCTASDRLNWHTDPKAEHDDRKGRERAK